MRRVATALVVVSLALLGNQLAFAQDTQSSDSPDQFERIAARYHSVLARQPRRGAAFDMLFRQYLDAGKLAELVSHYEEATEKAPDNYAAHLVLGLIYERRGQEEAALVQMRRAAELSDTKFHPVYYEALLLSSLHRDGEAQQAFERALKNNPPRTELQELYKKLGRLHARQGDDKQALAVWSRLADDFPNDRFAAQQLAELLTQEEQFDEAIRRYQQLYELAKGDVYQQLVAQIEVGQIQVLQGKLKSAIETFESCLAQVKPDSWLAADIRRRVEQIFMRSDDLSGLVEYYTQRLEQFPDDLATMTRRAAALAKLGNTDKAIEQLRQAVERAPSDHKVRQQLVAQLIAADKLEDATTEAAMLVEQNPTDVQYLQQLGDLYLIAAPASGNQRKSAEDNALEVWKRIADIRPTDAALAVQVAERCRAGAKIGSRYAGTGNLVDLQQRASSPLGQAALAYYQEAVRRDPTAPRYYEYLGEFQHSTGDMDEAIAAWKQIAAPPRDTIDNLRRLAEVLEGADQIDLAVDFTEAALNKDVDDYDLHALAARLLSRQQEYEAALHHMDAMEKLADSPALQEQAITQRVELYTTAGRLDEEREKLNQRLGSGAATVRDFWLAGMMANAQRQWTQALQHFDAAIALDPKDMQLSRYKAETHQRGGDLAGAAEQYRRLADTDTRGRSAHLRKVVDLELDLGRVDAAQLAAEQLIRFLPGNLEAIDLLARVYFRAGKQDEALQTLRSAVRLNPRDIGAREVLARALAERDQGDEAIEHYWRAFQLAEDLKDKVTITGALADQYVVSGRFEKLIERFELARRNLEDPLDLSLCLAEAYRRAEDYTSARRELGNLLARRPNDVQVLTQLVALSEALDDLEQASNYLEQIVELAPERANLERLAGIYQQLHEEEKAADIWNRLASEAKDEQALLAVIDRAERKQDFQQIITLVKPHWNRHRDDWRFGYRLVWALWQEQQYQDARQTAFAILGLAMSDKYREQLATTSSSRQASYYRRYPREMTRVHMPRQLRSMLSAPDAQSYRGFGWKPQDLIDAQMFCTVVLDEADRKQENEDPWSAKLERRLETGDATDATTMRQLAWVLVAQQKLADTVPLYHKWIEANPHDPEPRIGLFYALTYRIGRNTSATLSDEQWAELSEQYQWLAENRADLERWIAAGYVDMLIRVGEKEKAIAIANRAIDQATDAMPLSALSSSLMRLQDPQLLGKLIGRAQKLQQTKSSMSHGVFNTGHLLQQLVQLARQSKDWDQLVKSFDQYMDQTNPTSLRSGTLLNPSSVGTVSRTSRQTRSAIGKFPSPSVYLDSARLALLQNVYQSLRAAREVDKLVALADHHISTDEGTPLQCWKVCRAFLFWWEGEKTQSLELLDEVATATPGFPAPHILKARALAAAGDIGSALDVIKTMHEPFGRRAKELETFRMALALRGSNEEMAKQAALRLFGMRLTASEQVRLASVLRQLGLDTRSQALIQRVVTTSRASAREIHQIMQQQQSSDPQRAANIARRLLRQASRSAQVNSSNNRYRLDALRVLKQVGELDPLLERVERQLSEAPKSLKLMEDLAEYYVADGRDEDVRQIYERIIELRPNDVNVRYRIAQHYFQRKKNTEGLEQLGVVWEKDPQLILSRAYEIGRYYADANQMDTLAEHVRALKGSPHLQRYSYQLTNMVENLSRSNGAQVDDVIKAYEAVLEVIPEERRVNALRQFGDYLARQNRKQQAFDLYRQMVIPQPSESKSNKSPPTITSYVNGNLMTSFIRLADLAKDIDKLDKLEEEARQVASLHDEWSANGQLLVSMLKRRAGDEQPLLQLGAKYLYEEEYRVRLGTQDRTLREELANCESEKALRTAVMIWEGISRDTAQNYRGISSPRIRIAKIWLKIGDRRQARTAFLAARDYQPRSHYSPAQAHEQTMRHRSAVADAMRDAGFHLEAVAEYDDVLRTDTSLLQPNSYVIRSQLPRSRVNLRRSLAKLMKDELQETLTALEKEITREDGQLDLAPFFVVADPIPPEDLRRYGSGSDMKLPIVDGIEQQLLSVILGYAKQKDRLTAIAQRLSQLREQAPDDEQLVAFQTMVALATGESTTAQKMLEAWAAAVEERPARVDGSANWLLAHAALQNESTRQIGLSLAEQVATSAGLNGNPTRQQAALAAILRAGDEATSQEYLQKVLNKGKSDPNVLMQVADVHFDRQQFAEGVALLEPVWKHSPELLLARIEHLGPQYGQAGKLNALAQAIRSIHDPDLVSRYRYNIPNMYRQIPREERNVDGFVDLYLATLEFADDNMRSYAASQFHSSLSQYPQTDKVLAAYERAVFPSDKYRGQLENVATGMLSLAQQLKKLDRVESKCLQVQEQYPAWREADLLLAMIERRQGGEKRFQEFVQRYQDDASYAAAFNSSISVLRSELGNCSSPPVLELAARLWQQALNGGMRTSYNSWNTLAQIWLKLEQPQQAHRAWMEALQAPTPNYDENYRPYYRFQRRSYIADRMRDADYYVDAIRLYAQNQSIDFSSVGAQRYELFRRVDQQRPTLQRAVHKALTAGLDELLDDLIKRIEQPLEAADLSGYFVMVNPDWSAQQQTQLPEHVRGEDPKSLQLLPAVLRHAHAKDQLTQVSEAVSGALAKRPSDPQLAALSILIQQCLGKTAAISESIAAWNDAIEKDLESRPQLAEMLLVAHTTIADPATRPVTARLIDHAFETAGNQQDRSAQTTLWELADETQRGQLRDSFPEQFSQLREWYSTQAEQAEQRREWDDAIRCLDFLVEPNSDQWGLIQRRGIAFLQLGKHNRAIKDFSRAIELRPNDAELLVARGEAYSGLKEWEQAAVDFSTAIKLRPDDEALRLVRGRCFANAGVQVIVPSDSTWRWLHPPGGDDPATADSDFHSTFFTLEFDDTDWRVGKDSPGARGGFGYGDTAGVNFERPENGEHRKTAYFRHSFETDAAYDGLAISMQRDDGVIVYLDGVEVQRDNVGTDAEAYDLFAAETISGDDESTPVRFPITGKLKPGKHLLAISLHNRSGGSSDLRIAGITLQGEKDGAESLALDDVDALTDRGRAFQEQKRPARAITDFTRALELEPQTYLAHLYRADSHLELGKNEEAHADIEKAASLMKELDVQNETLEQLLIALREKL